MAIGPKWLWQCSEYCRAHAKAWDYFINAGDAFRAGYRAARDESGNPNLGLQEVENHTDYSDGLQQLTTRTFVKRNEENYAKPMDVLLRTYIPMVDFTDIRVEEKDGVISFQGTGKRLKP